MGTRTAPGETSTSALSAEPAAATPEATERPKVANVGSYDDVIFAVESFCTTVSTEECNAYAASYNGAMASNWLAWVAKSAAVNPKSTTLGKWDVDTKTSSQPHDDQDYNLIVYSDDELAEELVLGDSVTVSGNLRVAVYKGQADILLIHATIWKNVPVGKPALVNRGIRLWDKVILCWSERLPKALRADAGGREAPPRGKL